MNSLVKKGYIFPIIAAIIWGSVYIFSTTAMETLTSYELSFFRYAGGAITLFFIIKIKGYSFKLKKSHKKNIWIIGFFGFFASIEINMLAIDLAGPTISSLLNSLMPVGIMIAALIFLKEKISLKQWIMIAIALIGVMIVSVGDITVKQWIGVILVFVGIAFWSVASCHMRKIGADYQPFVVTFWGILISLIFQGAVLVIGIFVKGMSNANPGAGLFDIISAGLPVFNTATLIAIIYLGTAGTAVAQGMWTLGLSKLPASVCSMFYPIQPLSTAVLGVILGTASITPRLVIGGVIIAVAIIAALSPAKGKSADTGR